MALSALRLIQKSSCTTVHCGFLIFASLEITHFESHPAQNTDNSYAPHEAISPNRETSSSLPYCKVPKGPRLKGVYTPFRGCILQAAGVKEVFRRKTCEGIQKLLLIPSGREQYIYNLSRYSATFSSCHLGVDVAPHIPTEAPS